MSHPCCSEPAVIRTTRLREHITGGVVAPSASSPSKHLIIIGGGSAAHSAAIRATSFGATVTMVNSELPQGGSCVNVGCVPSKFLVRSAHKIWRCGASNDFSRLIQEKRALVDSLRQAKYVDVLGSLPNVRYMEGNASLVVQSEAASGNDMSAVNSTHPAQWHVEVNNVKLTGDACIVATGTSPFIPNIPGLDSTPYLTNETLYELQQRPDSLLVIGGGYIALENAQMMSRLGSKVTILQRSEQVLVHESPRLVDALQELLLSEGLLIERNAQIQKVTYDGQFFHVTVTSNGVSKLFSASHLLVAAGRKPNSDKINGCLRDGNGFILVDEHLRTNIPSVFAAGDVTGKHLYVYTAATDGKIAAENAVGELSSKVNYDPLPWVVFTDPQVAGVGIDEAQAIAKGIDIESSTVDMASVPRFIVAQERRGFLTLFRERNSRRIVGARLLAPEGGEMIMLISMAIQQQFTSQQLANLYYPYLTMNEAVKLASLAFDVKLSQLSCCGT